MTISAKGHGGQMEFDGNFVTIKREGFLARATQGKGEKRIPVRSVQAVQVKPAGPLINGFIALTLAGGNEKQSRFGRQVVDASKDENTVFFTKAQQPAFDELRAAIEAAMIQGFGASMSAPSAQAPPPPPSGPPAGWYPDSLNESLQRYWDGSRWTEHTAPR